MANLWTAWDLPPAYWWMFTYLAAASYLVVAAVSIWVALSRRHWFVRVAVVGGVLALTLPIGAYDLFLLFLTQAVVSSLVCCLLRWAASQAANMDRKSNDGTSLVRAGIRRLRSSPPRFTVTDLLLFTVVVACLAAVLVRVPSAVWEQAHLFITIGLGFGVASMALIDEMPSNSPADALRGWRAILSRVILASYRVIFTMILGATLMVAMGLGVFTLAAFHGSIVMLVHLSPWSFVIAVAANVALVVWMRAVRGESFAARQRGGRRGKITHLAWGVLACVLVAPLVCAYLALAWPRPMPVAAFPSPNAYDELLEVGKALQPEDELANWSEASLDELHDLRGRHGSSVDRARRALNRPCVPPIRYVVDDMSGSRYPLLRRVSLAFSAAGRLAELDGRTDDALGWHLDHARLGLYISRGEVAEWEWLVALGIERHVTEAIHALADELDGKTCRELLDELIKLEATRESLEGYHRRYDEWMNVVPGWQGRLLILLKDTAGIEDFHQYSDDSWRSTVAFRRLVLCRLALRIHELDHSRLPDTLAELTPGYLPAVPDDPFGTGSLTYHRDGDTYRLYSLGHDRRDDGGAVLAIRPDDSGDLFLPTDGKWPW